MNKCDKMRNPFVKKNRDHPHIELHSHCSFDLTPFNKISEKIFTLKDVKIWK
jgi:hypothetical protein